MKRVILVLTMIMALGLMVGCSAVNSAAKAEADPAASIVGTWESEQDNTVVEYTADGKYKGLNDLDYNYEIVENTQIKISNPEYADGSDAIILNFTLEGDVLKTVYNDYEVVWNRVKK